MTEARTWLSIASDDLTEIRGQVQAGNARWFDEDVVCRLLWDLTAAVVGLSHELHAQHRETVEIWKERRRETAQPLPEHIGGNCEDCPRCQAEVATSAARHFATN